MYLVYFIFKDLYVSLYFFIAVTLIYNIIWVLCVQHYISTSRYPIPSLPPKIYFPSVTVQWIPFTHFTLSPTTTLFSVSTCLFFIWFGLFIYFLSVCLFISFLYSPYELNHMVFVFIWLISLSIIPLRSIHVVTDGKILSFI